MDIQDPAAERLRGYNKPTIWSIMTPLAEKTKSINLGQGFPTWPLEIFSEQQR